MTAWKVSHVIFRLTAPMHIGCGKSGNLQRTYPFVTGRVFWGALTARITRNNPEILQKHGHQAYRLIGEQIHREIAYTYFYPAVKSSLDFEVRWPWEDGFAARHIRTYASTALAYPEQQAEEASLHETEYLSPVTCDTVEQVYLRGYVFVKESSTLEWQKALGQLQFGGERCYGWGDVETILNDDQTTTSELFDGQARFVDGDFPVVELSDPSEGHLLAHTEANCCQAHGQTEPLVGRELRSNNAVNRYTGQHIAFNAFCFTPGSTVTSLPCQFQIGKYGIWKTKSPH